MRSPTAFVFSVALALGCAADPARQAQFLREVSSPTMACAADSIEVSNLNPKGRGGGSVWSAAGCGVEAECELVSTKPPRAVCAQTADSREAGFRSGLAQKVSATYGCAIDRVRVHDGLAFSAGAERGYFVTACDTRYLCRSTPAGSDCSVTPAAEPSAQ